MKPLRLPLVIALSALLVLGVSAPAFANEDFRFEGKGWGHGIGMTQYGALEQAKDGRSTRQIIEHYYRTATVAKPSLNLGRVRVGLSQNERRLSVKANSANATIIFAGRSVKLSAGSTATFELKQASDGAVRCFLSGPDSVEAGRCQASINPGSGGSVTLSTEGGRPYGRGVMRLVHTTQNGNKRFHVVADLPNLETYMYGIHEVPAWTWAEWPASLQAQAIAARSYAAYRLLGLSGVSAACSCHVYDSIRDQVYGGLTGDVRPWRQAVSDTAGQVVYAQGASGTRQGVVQAFYSSSSGGRTENIDEVWNSPARPFYSSVDDRWSLRSSNPYRSWMAAIPAATVAKKLGIDSVTRIWVAERNASGSASRVVFAGNASGRRVEVSRTGGQVRDLFNCNDFPRNNCVRSAYIGQVFLPPFVDDDGSRFEADIVWIAEQGITKGCNPPRNDRYCPEEPVLRKQMAAFIVRAQNLTKTSSSGNFRDVPSGSTFAKDINKLATAGITKGCNPPANDRFCPNEAVSRAQMAAFLRRGAPW